jgi:hypothetical protein
MDYIREEKIFNNVTVALLLLAVIAAGIMGWRYSLQWCAPFHLLQRLGLYPSMPNIIISTMDKLLSAILTSAMANVVMIRLLHANCDRFGHEIIKKDGLTIVRGSVRLIYWGKLMKRLGVGEGRNVIRSEKLANAYGVTAVVGPVQLVEKLESTVSGSAD